MLMRVTPTYAFKLANNTMINRSSNVSARRAANSGRSDNGGGNNIVILADNHQPSSSSKTKDRKSTSRRSSSSFILPFLIASFTLLMMIGRPFLLPSSSYTTKSDHNNAALLQLRPSTNIINSKYKLTPKHKFPKGWKHFSYDHIRHHFNCRERSKDMNKPLPSLEDWNFLRRTYTQIVDNTIKPWNDDLIPPTMGYSLIPGIPVPPPYYARHSPGKGRGLFASRFIPKGELVHDGTVSDVIFPNDLKFREFIFALPRDYACDAAEWVWMQQLEEDGDYHLLMGINISALMNSGGAEWGDRESEMVNVVPPSSYSGKFYATRDIEEGEEILTDYDVYYTKWSLVGLGEK